MGNEKILKDQNVPSEPRAKYLCTDQKEKLATHSYNLRSKARQQQLQQREQESQVDINNNHRDYDDLYRVAVKRGYDYDTVDNETEDDSTTPLNTHMLNVRKSPPKKLKFVVTYKEMTEFFNLLKDQSISEFLRRDACCLVSDKYALAMVFTYFKRAKFTCEEFTVLNFYLGLYLASDVEEDIDEYKYEIFPWALGPKWRSKFSYFLRKRDALLKRIGYRAIVSRKCCDEVMSFVADHYAWKRERSEDHGGATRAYLITKGRRMLSNRSQVDDDDLNLPRGPQELPRPCPLCFLSKSTDLINNTRYFFPMKPGSLFMPKSTGLLQYATVFNSDTESADYDTSSNTSGYVSNESHASSNLSTYSTTETSFYSNGIDLTIRQKDDLPACIIKQVNTPKLSIISKSTNTNLNQINKDLIITPILQQHDQHNKQEDKDRKKMANLLFKSNIESNFIVNNKKSPNNFKSYNNLNFLKVKSNLKQTATSAATKYASVACVDQYQIEENSSDNDTDDLNGDLSGRDTYYNDDDDDDDNDDYDNNDDDDDNVFDCCEATLVKEKCSTKKKTSSCHVVFNSNIKITIRKVDQLVPKKKIISKN